MEILHVLIAIGILIAMFIANFAFARLISVNQTKSEVFRDTYSNKEKLAD